MIPAKSENVGLTELRWRVLAMTVLLLASARTAAAQTITEFPLPARTWARNIVAGPDGALWFTEPARNKIGRITTTGAVTEFPIPLPARVFVYTDIAFGPDGALWFGTENARSVSSIWRITTGESSIWRITTTGEFSEFPLPPRPSPPYRLSPNKS